MKRDGIETRKAEFLEAGEACMAIFWHTPGELDNLC